MQQHHEAHIAKLATLLASVSHTEGEARTTLHKFYKNCREIYTEMDKEMVQCRRRDKLTQKYIGLEAQYVEAIHTFEQWTVMAALMY